MAAPQPITVMEAPKAVTAQADTKDTKTPIPTAVATAPPAMPGGQYSVTDEQYRNHLVWVFKSDYTQSELAQVIMSAVDLKVPFSVGSIRRVYKDDKETDRYIVVARQYVIDNLWASTDSYITDAIKDINPYELRDWDFAKAGYQDNTLFVPIPEWIDIQQARQTIHFKFGSLRDCGLFDAEDYEIKIPSYQNKHKKKCYIVFNLREPLDAGGYTDGVSLEAIALARRALQDSEWNDDPQNPSIFKVKFAEVPKSRQQTTEFVE